MEALERFDLDLNNTVLILMSDNKDSIYQINQYGYLNKFSKVYNIFNKKRKLKVVFFQSLIALFSTIKGIIYFKYLVFKYRVPKNLFVGHIDYIWMAAFTEKSKPLKIILLEDGSAAINVAYRRYHSPPGEFMLQNHYTLSKSLRVRIEQLFLGKLKVLAIKNVTFFTVYDRIKTQPFDDLILNKLTQLKSQKNDNYRLVNEVWFIGQPIVNNLITKDEYNHILTTIKNYFGENNYSFFHINHKRQNDSPEYIKKSGYLIKSIYKPLEIHILQESRIPKIIVGYLSSSLMNLKTMFESNELKIFYIGDQISTIRRQGDVSRRFNYFEKEPRFKRIQLEITKSEDTKNYSI